MNQGSVFLAEEENAHRTKVWKFPNDSKDAGN